MSIKTKIESYKKAGLKELEKKERELYRLKDDIEYLIKQMNEGFAFESERIDKAFQALEQERIRFDRYKRIMEQDLESKREQTEERIDRHVDDVIELFEGLEAYGKDPKIVDAYINACYNLDGKLAKYLENKPRPNKTVAREILNKYRKENKVYLQRIKDLEYQLSELWAKDVDTSEKEKFECFDDDDERVRQFLTVSEYQNLGEDERNQCALDKYLHKNHSKSHVGKMYERYIGYLYESDGYEVEYRGIEMGLKDGGIDLVCRKGGDILLVQCKCWNQESTIYEKYICQLFGASIYYGERKEEYCRDGLNVNLDFNRLIPVFVYTNQLDEHAISVAKALGVITKKIIFDKTYPIIKCNINNNGEKIYHLPIDQMYDKTKICKTGETWVKTVAEAKRKGFRRAKRHFVNQ
jgi:hypothetical protein